ncbi:MAG: endonuclease/exonuclease/phosphatase family protein, partial [Planctomycetota bacterium]|nr:endonuclease/exonuclease/phosphatase family protein [Planctomycetota bacterium]
MGNGLRSMGLGCVGLVLGCLLNTVAGFSAEPESLEVKAMTFNIRNANPGDGPNYWGKRREWVAEFIGEQSPDVLGMQEVLKKQLDFLERRLPDYECYGVGRDDGKMAGEYSPIFYKKARFTRLDQGTFWLSTEPDKIGSRSWDAAITRICTWVQLQDRETERQIFVFNTHFDHRGEVARQESALLIRKRISESAKQLPWVLLG